VFADPIRTFVSFLIPMGQCHVPTHFTTISPSIRSIKLDPTTFQAGGLQSIVVVTSLKRQDHSRLKDALEPPTCHKSQLHMSLDQKCKKLSNGEKNLSWVFVA
jgi:hypothetical protein